MFFLWGEKKEKEREKMEIKSEPFGNVLVVGVFLAPRYPLWLARVKVESTQLSRQLVSPVGGRGRA